MGGGGGSCCDGRREGGTEGSSDGEEGKAGEVSKVEVCCEKLNAT